MGGCESARIYQQIKKFSTEIQKLRFHAEFLLVGPVGIEPTTVGLKGHCSTD